MYPILGRLYAKEKNDDYYPYNETHRISYVRSIGHLTIVQIFPPLLLHCSRS